MDRAFRQGTPALSPENPLVLGAGPLVGTGPQGASKVVATTRFPLNGTISESVGSMRFGVCLKGAGLDHVVLTGQAVRPSVLVIAEGGFSLIPAGDLWGRDVVETTDDLSRRFGGRKCSVIAIGPAGENRVAFALALVDKASTLGRGGLGAVMGAKHLKAIVATGGRRPRVHDEAGLEALLGGMRERVRRFKGRRQVLDMGIMDNWGNYVQQFAPCRNFSLARPRSELAPLYGPEVQRSFGRRRTGCPSCVMPDKERLEVVDGPHRGFEATTTSYFNSFLFGRLFDLNSPMDKTAGVRMVDRLDRAGVDMYTFGALVDFVITMIEEGSLDGSAFALPPSRGEEGLVRWLEAVVHRRGDAEALSDGWEALLTRLGPEYRPYAPIIKGCDVVWDPRPVGLGTMEFERKRPMNPIFPACF